MRGGGEIFNFAVGINGHLLDKVEVEDLATSSTLLEKVEVEELKMSCGGVWPNLQLCCGNK